MNNNNYCVIMCGGIGSRFWPYSKADKPKQFLDFLGTGRSLLQLTFDRFSQIIPPSQIFFVTNAQYASIIKEQLPQIDDCQILREPDRRNTAPCIAFASFRIKALNPNANIVVAPSDHLILKESDFLSVVNQALSFVAENPSLVTLGIQPTRPETGYGYIQAGEVNEQGFHKVKTFTEKPNLELAKVFLASQEFFWNAGIFVWNVNTIVQALALHQPEIYHNFASGATLFNTEKEADFIQNNFSLCPNISIDFGVMEKADNVFVLSADVGWSDLGTWGSLYDLSEKDDNQNVTVQGNVLSYDCSDNLVVLPSDHLAVIEGIHDCIVVQSEKTLLICRKSEEQRIKQFVADAELKYGQTFI